MTAAFRGGHTGAGPALGRMTGVLRRPSEGLEEAPERRQVAVGAEAAMTQVPAGTHQGPLETGSSSRERGRDRLCLGRRKDQPCRHLDLRLPASRTERGHISVLFSHLVCGRLYGSPSEQPSEQSGTCDTTWTPQRKVCVVSSGQMHSISGRFHLRVDEKSGCFQPIGCGRRLGCGRWQGALS